MAQELLDFVGRTPLVELRRMSPRPGIRIFAKLEGANPSGSVKDRIALALVEDAERTGRLRPGDTIIEASSGNTGIALTMVARQRGYEVKVVMPRDVAPSISDVLRLYGAEILWCASCRGMDDAIQRANRLAQEHGWHPLRQFEDSLNLETHYRSTGPEILAALPHVDAFVAGIGTGGTVMGVGRCLREANPAVRVVGVEPRMGDKLQGLRNMDEGYRPPLLDLDQLDGRYLVDNASAIKATARVIRQEGISAGISAGATLCGAWRLAERMQSGNIVVMFSDSGWKYLPARPWQSADSSDPGLDDIHWW